MNYTTTVDLNPRAVKEANGDIKRFLRTHVYQPHAAALFACASHRGSTWNNAHQLHGVDQALWKRSLSGKVHSPTTQSTQPYTLKLATHGLTSFFFFFFFE